MKSKAREIGEWGYTNGEGGIAFLATQLLDSGEWDMIWMWTAKENFTAQPRIPGNADGAV